MIQHVFHAPGIQDPPQGNHPDLPQLAFVVALQHGEETFGLGDCGLGDAHILPVVLVALLILDEISSV